MKTAFWTNWNINRNQNWILARWILLKSYSHCSALSMFQQQLVWKQKLICAVWWPIFLDYRLVKFNWSNESSRFRKKFSTDDLLKLYNNSPKIGTFGAQNLKMCQSLARQLLTVSSRWLFIFMSGWNKNWLKHFWIS